jgi:hypothetical protein
MCEDPTCTLRSFTAFSFFCIEGEGLKQTYLYILTLFMIQNILYLALCY